MKRFLATCTFAALLLACDAGGGGLPYRMSSRSDGEVVQLQGELRRVTHQRDSVTRALDNWRTVQAEKDSALAQVRTAEDFIDVIEQRLATMADVRNGHLGPSATENTRDIREQILSQLAHAQHMLDDADSTVRRRDDRIRDLISTTTVSDTELARLRGVEQDLLDQVDRERATVARLTAELTIAYQERDSLSADNGRLADTVRALRFRELTAHIVFDSPENLLQRGVVVHEGGMHIMFWKPGETLQPARTPPRSAFKTLDLQRDVTIDLKPGVAYRIISNHDPRYLDGVDADGLIRGQLRVRDPVRFWDASKWLILAEVK